MGEGRQRRRLEAGKEWEIGRSLDPGGGGLLWTLLSPRPAGLAHLTPQHPHSRDEKLGLVVRALA